MKVTSAGPSITQKEIDLVNEAVRYGWHDKRNFFIDQFAEEFADFVGRRYCLPTAHCTDAIHLALICSGISPDDEVIVPDLTWVASAAPICHLGAKPVFADVDEVSWCISTDSLLANISSKTKAVVVVDLLGNLPNWSRIKSVCAEHNIRIIEDAAESLGGSYLGKPAGSFGDISVFSFSATKLIMSQQGGALCTDDEEIYLRAKSLAHHGINEAVTGKYYWSQHLGHNYLWTNIQAALALAQLQRVDELLEYKQWLYEIYSKALFNSDRISIAGVYPRVSHSRWINGIIFDDKVEYSKEKICELVAKKNIDLRPMFYPLSSMPTFRGYVDHQKQHLDNPVSYWCSQKGVCLPNGYNITEEAANYVCDAIIDVVSN